MTTAQKDCCTCCTDTRHICLQTLQACLMKGGKCADVTLCTTLIECAQMCHTCADCCAMDTPCCGEVCATTAEMCLKAAHCCDSMDDADLKRCAEKLRCCAKECQAVCDECNLPKTTNHKKVVA